MTMMRPLAEKYAEYLTFVTVDVGEYSDIQPSLGLEEGSTSVLSLQNLLKGQVFPYSGKHITWAAVEAFIIDISKGKIKPWDGAPPSTHDEL
jgi:protein disulfide-isomerase A1